MKKEDLVNDELLTEAALSETQYLHLTSDVLPFDLEGTGFEISGKTKGAYINDIFLLMLVYLATKNIEKKWTIL